MAVGDPEVSRLDIGVLEMRPVYIFTHISLIVMIAKMMMISVQKRRIRSWNPEENVENAYEHQAPQSNKNTRVLPYLRRRAIIFGSAYLSRKIQVS